MTKRLRILIGTAAIGLAGALSYKLFEPIFTHNVGWADLPPMPQSIGETLDPRWANQGAAADLVMSEGLKEIGAPAISAALSIDGKLVWRGVAGLANVENMKPATFDTRFRIGSTSKAFTAVGVGVLIDRGKLNLDQSIPDFPHEVTLGQVMSHRAGIRNYGMCLCFPAWEHLNRRSFASVDEQVALVAKSSLLFKPGTDFIYTSLGFNLAGSAIENATGKTFSAYMSQAVFQPLGMKNTSLNEAGAASFYETEKGQYKPAFEVDNSIRWPSGGFVSTPTDVVKLGSVMLYDPLLNEKTRKLLVTVPRAGRSDGGKIYAYGWRRSSWLLHNGQMTLNSYHHGGTAVGSTSVFVILPDKGIVLSMMMNKGAEDVDALSAVADRILEGFVPLAKLGN